jgi:DNA polymerase V
MKENQIHSFTEAQTTGIELEIATDLHAGFPNPASDHAGETIDLTREMVRHPESTFYARIAGDSMLDAGIRDGDIVVVDRALEPCNGDFVVACVDGEFTLKEYQLDTKNKCVWLIPHNPTYSKIKVTVENNFIIWGVVTYCVHRVKGKS